MKEESGVVRRVGCVEHYNQGAKMSTVVSSSRPRRQAVAVRLLPSTVSVPEDDFVWDEDGYTSKNFAALGGIRAEARRFLSDLLADGPGEQHLVMQDAGARGISLRTIERAKAAAKL